MVGEDSSIVFEQGIALFDRERRLSGLFVDIGLAQKAIHLTSCKASQFFSNQALNGEKVDGNKKLKLS